jgi:hypothetical protein
MATVSHPKFRNLSAKELIGIVVTHTGSFSVALGVTRQVAPWFIGRLLLPKVTAGFLCRRAIALSRLLRFDHDGRLASGCFPARMPPEATDLHGLMRRVECKLAMIRCHAECAIGKS